MNRRLKVLFISRASLFTVTGGDTIQVTRTAEALQKAGVDINIKLCNEKDIHYSSYDLIHFFNIRHPADMLFHIQQSKLPYVISTIFVDYTKPAKRKITGIKDGVLNLFNINAQEYIKTVSKSLLNGEKIISKKYIWKGHKKSVSWILQNAALLLPNSENEYKRLLHSFGVEKKYHVVPNGVDTKRFNYSNKDSGSKDNSMVLCVARIELIKNQLNLIKALNGSPFQLYLIGNAAPNHSGYYKQCRKIAGPNIHFIDEVPQEQLVEYYRKAKVHVLPSWFETTGLASLEALNCGCNIVVTKYGDTTDYFDPQHCFFCDPATPASIRNAVEAAATRDINTNYIDSIARQYNWQNAAEKTIAAYQAVILNNK